jgi:sodium transport system permease protein
MRLDLTTVGTLYRTELRMALRDKRTVFFSLVLPLALMPLMMFSSVWVQKKRAGELAAMTHTYAVTGPEAKAARGWIATALARSRAATSAATPTALPPRPAHFEAKDVADPEAALQRAELTFYVVAERGMQPAAKEAGQRDAERAPHDAIRLTFVYRGDRDASRDAAFELRRRLSETRRDLRAQLLEARGFPVPPAEVARTQDADVASAGQVAGLGLGRLITLFLLIFIFTGGAVVATDALAGEKERGTLETLLATAAGRGEIIAAKSLVILTSALVITIIQTLNFLVYVVLKVIPTSASLTAAVTPATAALLFLLYLPMVALVSSALLASSGWARSYKESQLYFMPVMLVGLLPALAPMLPAIRLRSAIVVVPIANIAVAAKEILTGTYDWPFIALAWLATALAAAALARFTVRMLQTERLISSADFSREELTGGPELFPHRVLRAFALMWVAEIVAMSYLITNMHAQALFNIGVIFIGGSLLLIRIYRLDVKSALALRPVKPMVWLGVLAAVPGALLVAQGLGRLLSLVLPVPRGAMESFAEQLIPPNVPLWVTLPLVTLWPGIGEEIAFRGVLLHGLRKRLHPVALACVVGAAFGLFHLDQVRMIPAAYLGTLLAAVTLLTGSIFPAMAWHALSNGLALWSAHAGLPIEDLPPALYAGGVLLLALGFWIFWRNRTPYPDLRPWRRARP